MLKSAYHFIWVSHNLAPHNLMVRGHSNYDFCNQWSSTVSAYDVPLTHWGRVTHICVSKLTIIDSENGLSPDRRQAIIWTNAGILLIGPLGTNFSEIFNRNPDIVFQENTLESAVCKMAYLFDIMPADAMAPQVTRASTWYWQYRIGSILGFCIVNSSSQSPWYDT